MPKLDTKEALRIAIANIQAISIHDPKNYTDEVKKAKQVLGRKLMDLLTITEEE